MRPTRSSSIPSSDKPVERKKDSAVSRKKSSSILNQINIDHHTPEGWQKIIPLDRLEQLLETGGQIGLHVLVGDIRQSTSIMKESISSKEFAQITRDFVKAIKSTANTNEGWFDKFTGDGFIIYWIYGDDPNTFKEFLLSVRLCSHIFPKL